MNPIYCPIHFHQHGFLLNWYPIHYQSRFFERHLSHLIFNKFVIISFLRLFDLSYLHSIPHNTYLFESQLFIYLRSQFFHWNLVFSFYLFLALLPAVNIGVGILRLSLISCVQYYTALSEYLSFEIFFLFYTHYIILIYILFLYFFITNDTINKNFLFHSLAFLSSFWPSPLCMGVITGLLGPALVFLWWQLAVGWAFLSVMSVSTPHSH